MAQVRRQTRNPSPPPRQMPILPNPIRFYPQPPSSSTNIRRTQSLQVSHNQTTPQQSHPKSPQTEVFFNSMDDPLTNPLLNDTNKQLLITSSLVNHRRKSTNHHSSTPQANMINYEETVSDGFSLSIRSKTRSLDGRINGYSSISK